jgi:hypothetical protein
MTAPGAHSASWCRSICRPCHRWTQPQAEEEPGFPIIYKDDRRELTFILNTGAGVYSDTNPWFGQPELFNEFNPLAGQSAGQSDDLG